MQVGGGCQQAAGFGGQLGIPPWLHADGWAAECLQSQHVTAPAGHGTSRSVHQPPRACQHPCPRALQWLYGYWMQQTGGAEFEYDAIAARQHCKSGDWAKVGGGRAAGSRWCPGSAVGFQLGKVQVLMRVPLLPICRLAVLAGSRRRCRACGQDCGSAARPRARGATRRRGSSQGTARSDSRATRRSRLGTHQPQRQRLARAAGGSAAGGGGAAGAGGWLVGRQGVCWMPLKASNRLVWDGLKGRSWCHACTQTAQASCCSLSRVVHKTPVRPWNSRPRLLISACKEDDMQWPQTHARHQPAPPTGATGHGTEAQGGDGGA